MNQDKDKIASGKTSEVQAVDRIQEPLVRQWEFERDLVQGRSIRARWADMRNIFGHREDEPHAATRARNSIRECGPKTRERWGREYRCERKITRIMSNPTKHRATVLDNDNERINP